MSSNCRAVKRVARLQEIACAVTDEIRSAVLRQDMTLKAHQQGQAQGKRLVIANVGASKAETVAVITLDEQ